MTANLTITIDERNNVLKIPNSALRYRPQTTTQSRPNSGSGSGQANGQRRSQQNGDSNGQERITPSTSPVLAGQTRLVWVLGSDKKPQPRRIVVGLSDGTSTEVASGNLQEGDVVIIGETISGDNKPQATTQTAPGFGGGQRGGVGGGGGRR
jgi:HlyD family secretion protein